MILLFSIACPAGTYGKSCDIPCILGQYGKMCNSTCNCSSVQVCNNIFGCVCPEGLTGNKCDRGNIVTDTFNFEECSPLLQLYVKNI